MSEPEQPELPLDLRSNRVGHHRGEGERSTEKRPEDPLGGKVVWRRVHTKEKCTRCIEEQAVQIAGEGHPYAAWPASYVRIGGGRREALCFTHAAPLRHAEGLPPQRSGKKRKRHDHYE